MASGGGLKVIALISGGKDSLFSILHCLANGHEVVALGNLYPHAVQLDDAGRQVENEQDTDSYMYQTVGHSVIALYAEALGLPLYRRPLCGSAVDDSLNYSPAGVEQKGSDEAEDLYALLQDILKHHPEANAVNTGAILSTYQRMRVESVSIRLNLVPLSFLWHYPYLPPHQDASLLKDMENVGMTSCLIKVASGGLDASFLGKTVNDPVVVRKMVQRMKRFDPAVGAVLGEGGEFETLALAGPRPLWKKKVVLTSTSVSASGGDSFSLLIHKAEAIDYLLEEVQKHIDTLRVPALLDAEFQQLLTNSYTALDPQPDSPYSTQNLMHSFTAFSESLEVETLKAYEQNFSFRLFTFRGQGPNAFAQMQDIVSKIEHKLHFQIISTTLLLKDMADYQEVNSAYSKLFISVLPPARVTVALGGLLPEDCFVVLTIKIGRSLTTRQGLHVQSRSYWAPANIGPYSQAILEPLRVKDRDMGQSTSKLINVAGQIPLVPASMNSLDEQYIKTLIADAAPGRWRNVLLDASVALSLQHLWRIGRETGTRAWTGAVAYINGKVDTITRHRVTSQAESQWRAIHDYWRLVQVDDVDNLEDSELEDTRPYLPDMSVFSNVVEDNTPPCFAVHVANLPREVPIEWWSVGLSSDKLQQYSEEVGGVQVFNTVCLLSETRISWIGLRQQDGDAIRPFLAQSAIDSTVTVFSTCEIPTWVPSSNTQVIPCFAIRTASGAMLDLVLVIIQYHT